MIEKDNMYICEYFSLNLWKKLYKLKKGDREGGNPTRHNMQVYSPDHGLNVQFCPVINKEEPL